MWPGPRVRAPGRRAPARPRSSGGPRRGPPPCPDPPAHRPTAPAARRHPGPAPGCLPPTRRSRRSPPPARRPPRLPEPLGPGPCPRAARPRSRGRPGSGPRGDRSPAPAAVSRRTTCRAAPVSSQRYETMGRDCAPIVAVLPLPSRRSAEERRAGRAVGRRRAADVLGRVRQVEQAVPVGVEAEAIRHGGRRSGRAPPPRLPPAGLLRPEQRRPGRSRGDHRGDERRVGACRQYGGTGRFGRRLPAFGPAAGPGCRYGDGDARRSEAGPRPRP